MPITPEMAKADWAEVDVTRLRGDEVRGWDVEAHTLGLKSGRWPDFILVRRGGAPRDDVVLSRQGWDGHAEEVMRYESDKRSAIGKPLALRVFND